jgi:ESCRT-I complex subunit VPS28
MEQPAALHRLTVGVPATVEHSSEASDGGAETGKWVAETTQVRRGIEPDPGEDTEPQSFITFMDALKLNLRAKDQLHPFLTELMSGYSRFKGSQEWEGRAKILHWSVFNDTKLHTAVAHSTG